MLDRLEARSEPGQREDGWRVALAVEGGGMRGVLSAGMLLALEQLGLRTTVDLVVGTSAGALASAFFVDGRAAEGSVLFYTELNGPPFLDRSRLLKRDAAFNLDYLIRDAAPRRGLNFAALNRSKIELCSKALTRSKYNIIGTRIILTIRVTEICAYEHVGDAIIIEIARCGY